MGPALPPLPDFPAAILAAKRRRQRRWLTAALLLVVVGVLALPVYRVAKRWRGRALAAEAEKAAAASQWSVAIAKAQAAQHLAPVEPEVLRVTARVAGYAGAPTALEYWKNLLQLPSATRQDRLEAVRYALKTEQYDFAEAQLQVLLAADPEARETLELAVQFTMQKGDRAAALECTRILLLYHPDDATAALTRGELLLGSPEPVQVELGLRDLRKLARGHDSFALRALEVQARTPALSPESIPAVAAALDAHPEAKAVHHLAADSLRLRLHPEQQTEVIEKNIIRFRDGTTEEHLALARWLLQFGEAARVLALITPAEALAKQELFLVRADALAALGRWKEIEQAMGDEKAPLETFYSEIFLARAARQLEDSRGATAHWDLAILAAARDPQRTLYLSQYAEKAGEPSISIKAWRQLATDPRFTLRADLALVPLLQATGDTRGLQGTVRELAKLAPSDLAPRNDAAYLDLLLRENLPAARQTAEELLRAHPDFIVYRTTLALACLRAGEPAAAQKLYDGIEVAWPETLPRCQAVYAAVLQANGNIESAGKVLASLDRARLLPEEGALLSGER